ncbi:MAG: photosynthetic reaction center cytochrome c subunit family protein [Bryobacteraceae bacterium]
MSFGSRRRVFRFPVVALTVLISVSVAPAQTRPAQNSAAAEKMVSEKIFKNVTALKGISQEEFMATMGFLSASLGMNCVDCHVPESGGDWAKYADETPLKQRSRMMIAMVNGINKSYFAGRRVVTCYSCHRGTNKPLLTPSIAEIYGPPLTSEPDTLMPQAPRGMAPDAILDKYIQAVGGAANLSKLTSVVAKGKYRGYADDSEYPFELYAKAPNQRAVVLHGAVGNLSTVTDGKSAWQASPAIISLIPVAELAGGDLNGAKLDAALLFPGQIKQALTQWRTIFPSNIGGKRMQVVQGTADGHWPINLYFDNATGLLTRQVRFSDTVIGLAATQVDYADYRDVAGIKVPFKITSSWFDGRVALELTDVQPNAAVDASKFAKPAAPPPAPKASR